MQPSVNLRPHHSTIDVALPSCWSRALPWARARSRSTPFPHVASSLRPTMLPACAQTALATPFLHARFISRLEPHCYRYLPPLSLSLFLSMHRNWSPPHPSSPTSTWCYHMVLSDMWYIWPIMRLINSHAKQLLALLTHINHAKKYEFFFSFF